MKSKTYITDCEGPLTLNDNAYELSEYYIENGGDLFKILSAYDDFLADIIQKKNYKSGNTLKLIIPFFLAEDITNDDLINFSKNNISMLQDSKILLNYIKETMDHFIVSTSYGQYIEALCENIQFPFENTFYTKVDIDIPIKIDEKLMIQSFKKQILDNPKDYDLFDEIFFTQIPQMSFYDQIKDINVVGGEGKREAIESIKNIDQKQMFYIGDSITDVEPLKFVKGNGGISVSFNGNKYSLKAAEIAIVSKSAIASLLIAHIYNENNKNVVLKFIRDYNSQNDIKQLFSDYNVSKEIVNLFLNTFNNDDYPIIKIIDDENFNEILELSTKMRNTIRGQKIGELG